MTFDKLILKFIQKSEGHMKKSSSSEKDQTRKVASPNTKTSHSVVAVKEDGTGAGRGK